MRKDKLTEEELRFVEEYEKLCKEHNIFIAASPVGMLFVMPKHLESDKSTYRKDMKWTFNCLRTNICPF